MKSNTVSTLHLGVPGLLYALSLSSMIGKRTTLPILSHVLIESPVAGSEILVPTLRFTDLDLDITVPLVGTEGSLTKALTVPLKSFQALMNQLDRGAEITLQPREGEREGARIIQWDAEEDPVFRTELYGLPPSEFPELPTLESRGHVTFTGVSLISALKATAPAMSKDETRVILTGVQASFTLEGTKLTSRFVSTDTHRLHISSLVVAESFELKEAPPIVLRGSIVNFLLRFVRDTDLVRIEIGRGNIRVTITQEKTLEGVREIQIYSGLIEGAYPNYERVIPSGMAESMTVSRKQLIAAIKRASIIAMTNANRIVFEPSGNRLYLRANNGQADQDQSEAIIKDFVQTSDMVATWALNASYILRILELISDEYVTFLGNDPLRPFVVHAGQPKISGNWKDGMFFVCMPMQAI